MINKEKRRTVKASKKLLSVMLSAALVAGSCVPTFAAVEEVPVEVNDTVAEEITGTGNVLKEASPVVEELVGSKGMLDSAVITLSLGDTVTYNAAVQKPEVTEVKLLNSPVGTDNYVVDYGEGNYTDAGEYAIKVKGVGANYGGEATTTFTISKKSITAADIATTIPDQEFTGYAIKPELDTITLKESGTELHKGVDYDVTSYGTNTDAGEGTVGITPKGNYSGTAFDLTFKIVKSAGSLEGYTYSVDTDTFIYTGAEIAGTTIKSAVTVKDPSGVKVENADVTVSYEDGLSEAQNAGDRFTIETKVSGITLFKETYTVAKRDISELTFAANNFKGVYKNEAYTPDKAGLFSGTDVKGMTTGEDPKEVVTLKVDDMKLGTYSDNKNAGDATVTFTSEDTNVTGTGKITFAIAPYELAGDKELGAVINKMSSNYQAYYAGESSVKPAVELYFGTGLASKPVPAADYTVEYGENNTVGKKTGTVVIKPTDTKNFVHQKTIEFEIVVLPVAQVVVKNVKPLPFGTATLDDEAIKAGKYFTVTDKAGNVMKTDDYSFASITPNSVSGDKKVTVTLQAGIASGTVDVAYTVDNVTLYTDKAYTSEYKATYTTKPQEPTSKDLGDVTYTNGAVTQILKSGDYKVTGWSQNTEIGTAFATIEGLNEFKGTATVEFEIEAFNLTNAKNVKVSGLSNLSYNGGVGTELDASKLTVSFDTAVAGGVNVTMPAGSFTVAIEEINEAKREVTKVKVSAVEDKGFENSAVSILDPAVAYSLLDLSTVQVEIGNIPVLADYASYDDTFLKKYFTVKTANGDPVNAELYTILINAPSSADVEIGKDITYTISPASGQDAVVGGEKNGTFKLAKTDIGNSASVSVNVSGDDTLKYDGTDKTVTVVLSDITSTPAGIDPKEYTVSYEKNRNAGTAKVIVTAKADSKKYQGVYSKEFEIGKADIANAVGLDDISMEDLQYTGALIDLSSKAKVSLKDNVKYVVSENDYDITSAAKNPDDKTFAAGTQITVTLTAKATSQNYEEGTKVTKDYTVARRNIKDAVITLKKDTFAISEDIKPEVESVVVNGKTLAADEFKVVVSGETDKTTSEDNETKVVVTGLGNYTGSAEKAFTITGADVKDLGMSIGVPEGTLTYTGVDREAVVTDKAGDKQTVSSATDYEVIYTRDGKNVKADDLAKAGTYTATIQGKGNYSGTGASVTYTIKAKELSAADVKALGTVSVTLAYHGDRTVAEEGSITSENSLDWFDGDSFELDSFDAPVLTDNKFETGKGKIRAKANGNNTVVGTIDVEITWSKGELDEKDFVLGEAFYDGVHAAEPTVSFAEGCGLTDTSLLTVRYQNNDHIGKATASADIVVKESDFYESAYLTIGYPVKGDLSKAAVSGIKDAVYTGEEITQDIKVVFDGVTLVKDEDYSVTYEENINAGTAKVIITGIGLYGKVLEKTFEINAIYIAEAEVTVDGTYTYTGEAIVPEVSVKLGETVLDAANYDVTATENVNAGTAKVTVTGKGNYAGTAETTFEIAGIDISEAEVTVEGTYSYTGEAIVPEVSVKLGETVLDPADYEVAATDNTNAGTAKAVVTGKNNYAGTTAEVTFEIAAADISEAEVTVEGTYSYTGEAIVPEVSVKLGETVLDPADYDVAATDNVEIGTAKATVTGKGNYTGTTAEVPFEIAGIDISEAEVTVDGTYTYTGEAIVPAVTVKLGETVLDPADYEVAATDNTNAGTAKVTVTGKGSYVGTTSAVEFKIAKADQKLSVSKAITDALKIRNTNANTYTLKVTGAETKLSYESSDTKVAAVNSAGKLSFKHVCGKATITVTAAADDNYNAATLKIAVAVKPATPKITVTARAKGFNAKATAVKDITGYQVGYSTDKNFAASKTTKKLVKTAKALNKNFSGLSAKKGYYVRVRAYKIASDGTVYWGNWTAAKKITTK